MKKKILILPLMFIIAVGGFTNILSAQTAPTFYDGEKVQYNGSILRPVYSTGYQYYSVPCVADWNGDGNKDLIIGYFYQGWVYYYENSGTNSEPVFESEVILEADGSRIAVGYG